MKKTIEHLGQTIETKHWYPLTDEECEEIRQAYYEKPSFEEVRQEMVKVARGSVVMPNITNYYFKDLMAKVKMYHARWSIEEALQSNDIIRSMYSRTLENKKVFPDDLTLIQKIEAAFRLGGAGIAGKPSNFPLRPCREVVRSFHNNRRYYDFSCGWGVRMTAAMISGVSYFGTDPNTALVERLHQYRQDFEKVMNRPVNVNIYCQGSEIFIPELENSIGLAFSSPPYFGLEDYRVGEGQSYSEGMEYQAWVDDYLLPTMENNYRYLKSDGQLIVNINNYQDYDLVGSTIKACEEVGFNHYGNLNLKNIKRPNASGKFNDNAEGMMVFRKK